MSFFAVPALFKRIGKGFPASLHGAPMLMPVEDSALGRRLRSWFQARSLHPNVVGEFDDRALAKEFGGRGAGVFIGPTVLSAEIELRYGARALGVADELEDEFFAISIERRIRHPCVIAITESARNDFLAVSTTARNPPRTAPRTAHKVS